MSLRALSLSLALSFTIAFAPLAVRGQDPQPPQGQGEDPMELYRKAGASQEQEVRIRQLAKDFDDSARVRRKSLFELMQQMQTLSLQPDPDEAAVLAKQAEINKVNADISTDRIKLLLKIRQLLSAEQKEKLVALMKEIYTRRQQ